MSGDTRAQTLASLDAFLDGQRELLARTQADLHKLSQLRERALEHPQEFLERIEEELDDPAFKLSLYDPPQRPRDIDWNLFTSLDPSPFSNIAIPGPPPLSSATKQRSSPSELQTFVREASKNILADFKPFVPCEEEAPDDTDSDREDEQRLAELVKLGKDTSQPHSVVEMEVEEPQPRRRRVGSGLRLKPSRETLDPECGVDVSTKGKGSLRAQHRQLADMAPQSTPSLSQRPKRNRRPTARPDENYQLPLPLPQPSPLLAPELSLPPLPAAVFGSDIPVRIHSDRDPSDLGPSDSDVPGGEPPSQSRVKTKTKRQGTRQRKAPSETFNLPWSVSEQHLLERLLEEIPAGEKQRWAKISRAMAGRRTARQVASRVQKYFEKLKKFGVDPD